MWSERRRRLLFDSQHFCGFIDILLPALVASDLEGDEGHRALAARSHHRERQLTYSESRRFKWASLGSRSFLGSFTRISWNTPTTAGLCIRVDRPTFRAGIRRITGW